MEGHHEGEHEIHWLGCRSGNVVRQQRGRVRNASAESLSDAWRFRAVIYMWAAQITANATFRGGGAAPPGETEAVII